MKKILPFIAFFALIIGCGKTVSAQDAKAEEILNLMSAKYQKIKAFEAAFSYELKSTGENISEQLNGNITVKGDKYKLLLGDQEIYNNETTIWTYMKSEKEVTISNNEPDADDITPTKIFNLYKKGFKLLYLGEAKEGGVMTESIDLTPDDKKLSYFKVRITVNKADKSIKSWMIFEKNGRRYLYKIDTFKALENVKDDSFQFNTAANPKVEVVDLR